MKRQCAAAIRVVNTRFVGGGGGLSFYVFVLFLVIVFCFCLFLFVFVPFFVYEIVLSVLFLKLVCVLKIQNRSDFFKLSQFLCVSLNFRAIHTLH